MPIEHILPLPALQQPSPSDDTLQTKRCSACQRPLHIEAPFVPESSESANYCNACREARISARNNNNINNPMVVYAQSLNVVQRLPLPEVNTPLPRRSARRESGMTEPLTDGSSSSDEDAETLVPQRNNDEIPEKVELSSPTQHQQNLSQIQPTHLYPQTQDQIQREPKPDAPFTISTQTELPTEQHTDSPTSASSESSLHSQYGVSAEQYASYFDPLADITRLRVRSKGYKCLQPGATFVGTQKSGRNSYDVQVTLINVDFASSFACGYLKIKELTDDWPELTTYFDAQIIGTRYGFDTQDWDATRQEDMVHWARFPGFRDVQKDLVEPRLTLPANTSRSSVFMRWKERFLVPDHRVQDIIGASFAGFYYICVDLDPQSHQPEVDSPSKTASGYTRDRTWEETPATMSGFYYHHNSEPYQQLSLAHVREEFHSSFEFR